MSSGPYRVGLVSDFNTNNLAVLLGKRSASRGVGCVEAPYGQSMQLLLDDKAEFWQDPFDAVMVWTLPHLVAPTFQKLLACEEFSMEELLSEVDVFCELVQKAPPTVRIILCPQWAAPEAGRGLGPLDLKHNIGVAHGLMRMNLRLAERFERDPRVILFDVQQWVAAAGASAYSAKLWYLSKTPFHNAVFQEAAQDIVAALDGVHGRSKKVVVLDLDNTLWGGVVGEEGWERLRLGGHDALGEAFADFQKGLKRLTKRGVLLAIASKNEESVALEAIRKHPEMVLKLEEFAAWRINWRDKAQNIREILLELNLGLDSAVFLDDTPFERARVREALPEVFVPDLPADPMQFPLFLSRLRCFDNPVVSKEDRVRTSMYVADRQRVALKTEVGSLDKWLDLLELRVFVEPLTEANLERAAQLLNKTNQMNLSTRRQTAAELMAWSQLDGHRLWTFRVADKFGDYGLCGLSSFVHEGKQGRLLDFLLSCRVMGRGVEDTMLCIVAQHAQSLGCRELAATYLPTPKNRPMEKWLQSHTGLQQNGDAFRLSLVQPVELPRHVRISGN